MAGKLSLSSRFMKLMYKFLRLVRHRGANEVAHRPATDRDFRSFRGHHLCLLITHKRNGEPVPTPVNFGLSEDGNVYLRGEPHSMKMRRLRHSARVRVCVSTFRGKPMGPLVEGIARIVGDDEEKRAFGYIARNWRKPDMWLFELFLDAIKVPEAYVEITPVRHHVASDSSDTADI